MTDHPLPATLGAVIVPADGHDAIEATDDGLVYRTREAVHIGSGLWQGEWQVAGYVDYHMTSLQITPGTWTAETLDGDA